MGWSQEWNELFQAGPQHRTVWPWSDLVSHVMRHTKGVTKGLRVLEVGCGAGANIPFFKSMGVEYFAIEGSEFIVQQLKDSNNDIRDHIVTGDFTEEIPFDGLFDLVVDRCSITHNTTRKITNCLDMIHHRLVPGGKFIGIDWFSTEHTDYAKGEFDEDSFTKKNVYEGHLANTGRIHFSDKIHLQELFHRFTLTAMEQKIVKREIPNDQFVFAAWNFVAQKD
ncbi:class I SAM-dependent methyltransferase [Paenibacillus frigoriresistens]|uniref:class I SAM-dependent methyltransferase n=1 Tax=Paenibacillus alginolyticus TaxID=59839 RepID=UPI0015675022|nr:class I SAM-dependent methyltransferase [Paenibacillus frigoriresistens]NRF93669.1 class I SAM-dependent methyltransferase [Paenibacillus frigoriresistens]